ncbi:MULTISPECIES: response regulator transcription factor [unclassified Ruegeria]|uniref:response regulator transcription factor n=1 Tax=unclassified Ruegeria TaxID=2625375 RepID=UPI001ADAF31F|nr:MULTISPECIES: response regulator transcription factor [unclassified Ruegeria]MBO9412544.1 response regulator transcription factor [Ruegeria sp. R8_1]MBO9416218.1 response regulator transcription factor [Ruegeria sp. R8_2]
MKVLLVEDDAMHANYLKELVQEALPEASEVSLATNGRDGEIQARQDAVEAIVMDLRMKERNGIEAARTIWSERPDTRILFWSNYSDEAYLRGIARIVPKEAAYGYVLKTASPSRMHLALRAVLLEAQIMVDREIHQIQRDQNRSGEALTEVELAILTDLALGLPDKAIAARRKLALRTIQNRLLSIYEKLDVNDLLIDAGDVAINKRVRAVSKAMTSQILNNEAIVAAEKDLSSWLARSSFPV